MKCLCCDGSLLHIAGNLWECPACSAQWTTEGAPEGADPDDMRPHLRPNGHGGTPT